MRYLMVVPVTARTLGPDDFATEGPFADHLRVVRELLHDEIDELVVAGVEMRDEDYARNAEHLGVLHAPRDHVRFVPLFPDGLGRRAFWTKWWPRVVRRLIEEVARAKVVHAGPSHDLWRPFEVTALGLGAAFGRTTLSVTDIDERESARMMYETGRWSRRVYSTTRYLHDPLRDLQHRAIVRACDLVLFKGDRLVADYGGGRPHVHGIFDPGFEAEQVVGDDLVREKLARLREPGPTLQLLYFGRFAYYKGVHHMVEALAQATDAPAHLHLMGYGAEEPALRRLVDDRRLGARVTFHEPVRYGPAFFDKLRGFDLMLAAPLGVDTPRSAWDAFASGLPILAYDTEFYAGLAHRTGAVEVVPWNDVGRYAERLRAFALEPASLAPLVERAVAAARDNTQRAWLERRAAWTREALEAKRGARPPIRPAPPPRDEHVEGA
ncbi:MAG: glycosyltransferase [Sandaracinaceae bacterium]|nr:glycosyltransferase [Sandaracinaceae bacterium]